MRRRTGADPNQYKGTVINSSRALSRAVYRVLLCLSIGGNDDDDNSYGSNLQSEAKTAQCT